MRQKYSKCGGLGTKTKRKQYYKNCRTFYQSTARFGYEYKYIHKIDI